MSRDALRCAYYWTRQWTMLDPHVSATGFSTGPDGEIVVQVHQVVHDREGKLLLDEMVGHLFRIESGLIKRFDIADRAPGDVAGK